MTTTSSALLFDGVAAAAARERVLAERVGEIKKMGRPLPVIAALLFEEDAGSVLYTEKKRQAAQRVGIGYQVETVSLHTPIEDLVQLVQSWNADPQITGTIIQKPWRKTWRAHGGVGQYANWWRQLTEVIAVAKDVDGLHPSLLASIRSGTYREEGRVLPATCRAVLSVLAAAQAQVRPPTERVALIGRSDLLGLPLQAYFEWSGVDSELLGRTELAERVRQGSGLKEFGVVISATGVTGLITADLLAAGSIAIDVGEPHPDVDFNSVRQKARFLTPVPGGIGPMTVVSLLENGVALCQNTDV